VMKDADSSLTGLDFSDRLNRSDYVQDAIGSVPEKIYPEEFRYDPDAAECDESRSLEETVLSIWSRPE